MTDSPVLKYLQINHRVVQGRPGTTRLRFDGPTLIVETESGIITPETETFIRNKQHWIAQHARRLAQLYEKRSRFLENIDRQALIFGHIEKVSFREGMVARYDLNETDDLIITALPKAFRQPHYTRQLIHAYLKNLAETYLQIRLAHWAEVMGVRYNQLRIKNHRSKWGSCSSRKNINLNWHLVMLSKPAIDYIVVHELSHLLEMNHGPRFWAIVQRYVPRYKEQVAYIRDHQWIIGLYD
jgi:predicted metal-dependent hydrolase